MHCFDSGRPISAVAPSSRRLFLQRLGMAGAALATGAAIPLPAAEQAKKAPELAFVRTDEALRLTYGPRDIIRYQLRPPGMGASAVPSGCYFHPFATPAGTVITEVGPDDHRHHRGIFLGWVEMHGPADGDFWGWGEAAPVKDRQIVNRSLEAKPPSLGYARIRALNDWMADGRKMVSEDLRAGITFQDGATVLNYAAQFSVEAPVTLARQAFGGFALRTRKDGELTPIGPAGEVKLAAPKHTDPSSNWPESPWYGLHLKLKDGKEATVAVVGRKENPPTTWHVASAIGLVNPCITAPAAVTLTPAKPLVLRYRVVVMDGPPNLPVLNKIAESWYLGVQN